MEKVLYTIDEVVYQTGLGRTFIYKCINDGRIESVRIGTARRVPADAVTRFVEQLRGTSSDATVGQ